VKTGATALYQSVQGGKPFLNTLATWMGIEPMPTKFKGQSLTTRPGGIGTKYKTSYTWQHNYKLLFQNIQVKDNTQYLYCIDAHCWNRGQYLIHFC